MLHDVLLRMYLLRLGDLAAQKQQSEFELTEPTLTSQDQQFDHPSCVSQSHTVIQGLPILCPDALLHHSQCIAQHMPRLADKQHIIAIVLIASLCIPTRETRLLW